jgi:chromosomal replication initiation ATPase DnaA
VCRRDGEPVTPRVRHYTTRAAALFGMDPEQVFMRRRSVDYVIARALVWDALRADGFSYSQIGRWTGRDHSTVMNALKGRRGAPAA